MQFLNNDLKLRDIRALIIDIDGTLWRGSRPMPGLVRLFDLLHRYEIAFTIVTNNTVKTPAQVRQKLAQFGVTVPPAHVLTAATATAIYLSQNFKPGSSMYMIGESGLRQALQEQGFTILDGPDQPAGVVVVGGDRALTYQKLKDAIQLIQRGADFVGTNPDLLVPAEDGLAPEAGTTLAAIQAATGIRPTIVGKPEHILFDLAVERLGCPPSQIAVLGDRLETDILGGQRAGLQTILVTTGVDNEHSIPQKGIYPALVVSHLDELIDAWQSQF